jgi:hypothetical protein
VVVAAQAAAGWSVAGWVRQVAACLAVRVVAADSCAALGISAHLVAVVERRASLPRLAVAAVAVALWVVSMDYGLALVLVRAVVLVSVPRMAWRLARASAVRRCISRAVGCGSSITATSTFLCRLLAPGFGVTILAGGTPIGGGSTATTADALEHGPVVDHYETLAICRTLALARAACFPLRLPDAAPSCRQARGYTILASRPAQLHVAVHTA